MKKFIVIGLILFSVVFIFARGIEIQRDYDGIAAYKVKNTSASNNALSGFWALNNVDEYTGIYKAGTNHINFPSDCFFINNKGDSIYMNNNATAKEWKWYQATTVDVDDEGNITNVSGTNQVIRIDANGDFNILTGSIDLAGISEPGAESGYGKIFVESANSNLYYKDEGGVKLRLGDSILISDYVNQSGTKVIDIDGAGVQTYTLDGNITFSSVNNLSSTISKSISAYIIESGTAKRTLTFNANWLWIGTKPANITNATGLLLLTTKGISQSDVVASYEETQ
jgi:hypothetical protein